ncbi:MAG TPA: hypothetical protein PKA13_19835 [Geminicoccaceae bacterium]|nr:hypothetical protein [Geminicoccus sp.]HMU52038.1 hypothetical protein [Geminicoccaceae bacterium]
MTGLLNLAYPAFDTVDGWLALLLPAAARLAFWGALSGGVAMVLYAAMSRQERLQALKRQSAELRTRVAATEDAGEAARLALQNVRLSFRFLGAVLGPALLSGIPVLFVLAWVSHAYSYDLPAPGRVVPVTVEPAGIAVTLAPAAPEETAVTWPGQGERIDLRQDGSTSIEIPADELELGLVHKRRWWNWLLGNEAGYLPDDGPADTVRFGLEPREVLSVGPSWVRGWAFVYFASLLLVSLAIKLGFRIV